MGKVLILVLMECGWNWGANTHHGSYGRLNPCSNGMRMELFLIMAKIYKNNVLILVLMECGWNLLRHTQHLGMLS